MPCRRGQASRRSCANITSCWRGLSQEIDRLNADDAVRVIIVRAEGRGFCGGVDAREGARPAASTGASAIGAIRHQREDSKSQLRASLTDDPSHAKPRLEMTYHVG